MVAEKEVMAGANIPQCGVSEREDREVVSANALSRSTAPKSRYTFPKGKPIPLVLTEIVFVASFSGLAVRWIWVHGSFGGNGVHLLVATVVVFGFVDYRLLRFYEQRGRALRVERYVP